MIVSVVRNHIIVQPIRVILWIPILWILWLIPIRIVLVSVCWAAVKSILTDLDSHLSVGLVGECHSAQHAGSSNQK